MNAEERKKHWESIFNTKDTRQVSWYQDSPERAVQLINGLKLSKSDKIIDVGCGDGFLVDRLLDNGYKNICLLDVSEKALNTVKTRLALEKEHLNFRCCDITCFNPQEKFNVWHDRAVFHFLIKNKDIEKYKQVAEKCLPAGAYLIIGTFSINGPNMCSALKVRQYSEESLCNVFKSSFEKVDCFEEDHRTPSGGIQIFQYCIFKRLA